MEETLRFSVFKEKIIKTNELLHLHLEKTREVDKLRRCYQQLKAKLELCKEENKKLQLKNDALSYNSRLNEKELGPLREQYNKLKQQEDSNGKIINDLQINYQLVCQELDDCKAKLSKLEEHSVPEIIETKRKSPVKRERKRKNEVEVDTTSSTILNKKINELVAHKNKIVTENSNLKLEICKLKKEINNLELVQIDPQEELKSNLTAKEQEIKELKLKLKSLEEDKDIKIDKLLKKLEHLKLANSNLEEENEKLKNANSSYQIEISMLQANVEEMDTIQDFSDKIASKDLIQINDLQDNMDPIEEDLSDKTVIPDNVKTPSEEDIRDNVKTPSDEEIERIFNEMTHPACLSPVPSLNIRESMPFEDDTLTQRKGAVKRNKQITSSSGEFMVSDFCDITKISTKKYKHKRRKKVLKTKTNKIDLLGALIALKEANINFTVSSGACVHFERLDSVPVRNPYSISSTKPVTILCEGSLRAETFSCKLECSLACCKNSFMALKGSKGENASLLGFFDVKNENVKQFKEHLKKSDNTNCTSARKRKQNENSNDRPKRKIYKSKNSPQHVEVTHTINTVEDTVNSFISDNLNAEISPIEENPKVIVTCETTRRTTRSSNSFNDTNTVDETAVALDISDTGSNTIEMRRTKSSSTCDNNPTVVETSVVLDSNKVNRRKTRSCSGVINSNKKIYKTRNALKKSANKPIFNRQTICDESGASLPVRKRIAHTPNSTKLIDISNDKNSQKAITPDCNVKLVENVDDKKSQEDITPLQKVIESMSESESNDKAVTKSKLEKTSFKRPLCRTRQATKLIAAQEQTQTTSETNEVVSERSEEVDGGPPRCPESPAPENESLERNKPKIIPLERVNETPEKMPTSKIEMLFTKLVNYSLEEEVLNEVVSEFLKQDPEYIAQAILEKISKDYYDPADSKYSPAPLMTETQRTMLGFMSKLEKSNVIGVFDNFLTLAEHRLLTCQDLHEIAPITRLYLAVCKLHHNLHRMRKLCCDMFYFCGDFAVPFFFFVLTSWSEVLPHEANSKDMPLARVLVQIIYMKECNRPGYNLMPLRDLLIKFYGYPTERWDSNELFQELFRGYLRNPVRSSDFALLLLCKNHPEKWVHEKIEEHLKPIVNQIPAENFKAAVIIFIGNLYNRFSSKSQINYLPGVRQWLSSLLNETTPDVVKRSVYLCLNRLKKK